MASSLESEEKFPRILPNVLKKRDRSVGKYYQTSR